MRAKPSAQQKVEGRDQAGRRKDRKVDAGGLFPKQEIEQPTNSKHEDPEFVWIIIHGFLLIDLGFLHLK